jgi:septal ring factor EnvC (AmiA/AmiB activator)
MRFLKIFLFFILVFTALCAHAQPASSSSELKKRRDKLTEELQQLNQQYQETSNNKKASLAQLKLLKAQIDLREDKISNINSEIRGLDNQISESTNSVHSLQSQLTLLKKEYAAMILFAYRNQSAYNKLMFIFAAQDFNQSYKRLKYLQQIGGYRERQAAYIQGTEKDLHIKINQLDETKKEKDDLLKDQEKEKQTLGEEKNTQVKVVSDLSKQIGSLKQQQNEVQHKIALTNRFIAEAVHREIEEARREAEEAARLAAAKEAAKAKAENREVAVSKRPVISNRSTTSEVLNATPEAAKLSSDFLGNRGRLPWPVANGIIIQGFGTYYSPEGIKSESTGVDIKSNSGANVRAVFDGVVSNVHDIEGTYLIIVRHGEYLTVYSNLKSVNVAKGDKVSTKQAIGTVATDPTTGITEVHFDLYKGVTPVDPKYWLVPN